MAVECATLRGRSPPQRSAAARRGLPKIDPKSRRGYVGMLRSTLYLPNLHTLLTSHIKLARRLNQAETPSPVAIAGRILENVLACTVLGKNADRVPRTIELVWGLS